MKAIDLERLENCLNSVSMDDQHEGFRPPHAAAQLYFGRNDITNEQLTQIEAALDAIVEAEDLDRRVEYGCKLYRSQKFGSQKEQYLAALERRANEAEELAQAAKQMEALYLRKEENFFDKDYAWFNEAII